MTLHQAIKLYLITLAIISSIVIEMITTIALIFLTITTWWGVILLIIWGAFIFTAVDVVSRGGIQF